MKSRGYVLFFYVFVLIFNHSFAMDHLDRSAGSLQSSTGSRQRTPQVSGSSGSYIGAPVLSPSFMNPQGAPMNLSPSIELFMQFHSQGTATYMEAFEEYRKNIKRNEAAYRALLPKFYTACSYYLDAWENGDPTAEGGYIRSFQYAEIIIKILLEKKSNQGASIYPEQHHEVFQRARRLREQDIQRFGVVGLSDDVNVKEQYSRGFSWYLHSQTSYSEFIMHRDSSFAKCIQQVRWAAAFLLKSLEKKQTADVLKRLIDILDIVQPSKWGYENWPEVQGSNELTQTVLKLNRFYKIDSMCIEILKYKEALQGLQSVSPTSSSSRPILQTSFSHDSVAATVSAAARAAALGRSDDSSSSDESQEQPTHSAAAAAVVDSPSVPPLTFHPADSGGDNVPPDKPTGSSRQSRKLTPRAFVTSMLRRQGGKKDEHK